MNFCDLSDDELLDELDFISLKLSCCMGNDEYNELEGMYWEVIKELNKREITLDEEGNKEKGMGKGYRKDKDDFKGCFDGREEGDDGLDLPF